MPQKCIAANARQGITTPANIQQDRQIGNTAAPRHPLIAVVQGEAICWLDAGSRDFDDIAAIFRMIERFTTDCKVEDRLTALNDIRHLARMAGHIATETADYLCSAKEQTETALLAVAHSAEFEVSA